MILMDVVIIGSAVVYALWMWSVFVKAKKESENES